MATTRSRPQASLDLNAGYTSEPFQILSPDGTLTRPELAPDLETVERFYREMSRLRHLDDRFIVLARQNKMGTYPPFGGQEGSQVGTVSALEASDYLVPMYRNTGSMVAFGWPIQKAVMYWRAHPEGWRLPDDLNIMPIIIDIAAQYPHAAGIAMAQKLQGLDRVAMTYIGEGGTSQGDFHVGLNWASSMKAPAVFIIENNGWAISVPRAVQSQVDYLVKRAEGYGIPGFLVDGNDVLAVNHIARFAVERARRGDGPSLIENLTYRVRPHTTGDDPKAYRTEDEAKEWMDKRDPLARVRKYMEAQGHWNEDREAAMHAEIETEWQAAIEAADSAPPADPRSLLEYAMVNPTQNLIEQEAILEERIRAMEGGR
ncbi:MAG TPA: thiamine pyrophosphate-dependent dehydrogenase E1 component subunit alpha [Deinococcales bacterium]|nr:thiamine pyrophosphate-dependent dehydrogenase E1 component subunit alpha [Deinococcales bacterium]